MTLRVGFASAVRHAHDYLRILGGDERVRVVAVAEEAGAAKWARADSRAAAQAAGVPFFDDLDAVLDAAAVDLVVVCSEPTRHARLALRALAAGVEVLVDKPVATTLADADAVLAAARGAGRHVPVINRTHAPALRRARAWLDAGHLGLPRHLDLEFFASGAHLATSVERPELITAPELSGGGELLNFMGYCADAVTYLTGLATTEVFALTGALFSGLHRAHGVEDSAVVTLGLEHDVSATVTLGRVPYAPGTTPTTSSVRILGSHGHAVLDDEQPAVDVFGATGAQQLVADAGQVALKAYLHHVVHALVAGEAPDYTVVEARSTMAVIDAAYRSAASGALAQPT